MGIQGLLPQLKPIQNPVTLSRYEGQILGIDGYAWLHRSAYSCAHELALGKPTEKYLQFFIKKISMLRNFKIEPYFVFDGGSISVKKDTELKRRQKRLENKAIAERLWNSGDKTHAMEYFQKCVDITPEMAKCIIDYCKINRIKYVVAPFEADSQMVYLEKHGLIDGIISEDSDLLIFGCRKLITKLNDFGECIEICSDDFKQLRDKFPLYNMSLEAMRTMVALAGCDYTDGLPKIGLVRAIKLVQRFNKMEKIINHIKLEGKIDVPSKFYEEYELANYSFQFQRVYCPERKIIVPLNDIPEKYLTIPNIANKIAKSIGQPIHLISKEHFCGVDPEDIDHELHRRIAIGELNPYDYKKRLINREHTLELTTTKSEIVQNDKRIMNRSVLNKPKTRPIESFFGINRIKREITPLRSNTTMGTVSRVVPDMSSVPVGTANSIYQERRYFSTSDKIKESLHRQESKTDRVINNRLLTVRAKRSISVDEQVGHTVSTTTSKFFAMSRQEMKQCSSSTSGAKIVQHDRQRSLVRDSEVETEVPESMVSTQISTRPVLSSSSSNASAHATYEDESASDLSENDGTIDQDEEDVSLDTIREECKPRKLIGSKNLLESFRYDSNGDGEKCRPPFAENDNSANEEKCRPPFTECDANQRVDRVVSDPIQDMKQSLDVLNRRNTNSIVFSVKRSNSSGVMTDSDENTNASSARGIKLTVSRSNSQNEMTEGSITDRKGKITKPTKPVAKINMAKKSISTLAGFAYQGI